IFVGSLGSKEQNLLLSNARFVSYVSPGYLWYVRDETLLAQPFDAKRRQLSGEPVAIVGDFERGARFRVTASETGMMVYQDPRSNRRLTWFDRHGQRLGKIGEDRRYVQITLSPDEKRVAAQTGALGDPQEIWIGDIDRTVFTRFAKGIDPIWSPSGDRLLFRSGSRILQKNLDGGAEKVFLDAPERIYPEDWTRDGRYALFDFASGDSSAIWAAPTSGNRKPIQLVEASFKFDEPQVSPDGRWLAYSANETGHHEVYMQPFLKPGRRIRISSGGGGQPKWRKDSKELFFLALDGTLMAVDIGEDDVITVGVPKPLFHMPINVRLVLDQYAVTGDGQRFLVITEGDETSPPFEVILNWPGVFMKK
ncbi:hypothetical protein MJD09_23170, partial [bacterium]|nr:hypothetical protein [bacterium]